MFLCPPLEKPLHVWFKIVWLFYETETHNQMKQVTLYIYVDKDMYVANTLM